MEHMTIEDKIDLLVRTKEWGNLTVEEKTFLHEHAFSEDQFNSLKKLNLVLPTLIGSEIAPRKRTLESLKNHLKEKHSHETFLSKVMSLRMPAYASVLFLFLGCAVGWFMNKRGIENPKIVQVPLITRDTVYLPTKADTVYIDRIIVRRIPSQTDSHNQPITIAEQTSQSEVSLGVNMKEKSELDNLLVSGSE